MKSNAALAAKYVRLSGVLAAVFCIGLLHSAGAAEVANAARRAAAAGELTVIKGQRLLRLFGTDVHERGFANGFLSGTLVVSDLEAAIKSLPNFSAASYDADFLPWMKATFRWDLDANTELDGVFEGLTASGEKAAFSKVLNRTITRDDLLGMNSLADYYGPACSAFAAWGDRTSDGHVIHARTLDFPIGPEAVASQIAIANEALPDRGAGRPARKAFVAVGWPGMISHYSGMNADGLVVCLHDGMNVRGHASPHDCVARGVLLRRMLETIDPAVGDAALSGARMAEAAPSACGNLFHMTWPTAAAHATGTQPSAILEFDPMDKGAVIRRPEKPGSIVLTNHFCVLNHCVDCNRFAAIASGLEVLGHTHQKIGLPEARKLLLSAEQPVGAHSLYFFPDTLELDIALTQWNVMSVRVIPTPFRWDEFFGKR